MCARASFPFKISEKGKFILSLDDNTNNVNLEDEIHFINKHRSSKLKHLYPLISFRNGYETIYSEERFRSLFSFFMAYDVDDHIIKCHPVVTINDNNKKKNNNNLERYYLNFTLYIPVFALDFVVNTYIYSTLSTQQYNFYCGTRFNSKEISLEKNNIMDYFINNNFMNYK